MQQAAPKPNPAPTSNAQLADLASEDTERLLFFMKAASTIVASAKQLEQFLPAKDIEAIAQLIITVQDLAKKPILDCVENKLNDYNKSLYKGFESAMNHIHHPQDEVIEGVTVWLNEAKKSGAYQEEIRYIFNLCDSEHDSTIRRLKAAMITLALIDTAPFVPLFESETEIKNVAGIAEQSSPFSVSATKEKNDDLLKLIIELIPIKDTPIRFEKIFAKLSMEENEPTMNYMFKNKNGILAVVTTAAQHRQKLNRINDKELGQLNFKSLAQSCNLSEGQSKINQFIEKQLNSIPEEKAKEPTPEKKAKQLMSEIIEACKTIYAEKKGNPKTLSTYQQLTISFTEQLSLCTDIAQAIKIKAAYIRTCLGLQLAIATVTSKTETIDDRMRGFLLASTTLRGAIVPSPACKRPSCFFPDKENKRGAGNEKGPSTKIARVTPPTLT